MKKRKKVIFYLVIVGIAALTLAIALLRHDETSTGSTFSDLASTTFLVFCTLGPSILLKIVIAKLWPVEVLSKNRRRLQRELRIAKARREHAKKELDRIAMAQQWWDEMYAMLRAEYLLAYRDAGGTVSDEVMNAALRDSNLITHDFRHEEVNPYRRRS